MTCFLPIKKKFQQVLGSKCDKWIKKFIPYQSGMKSHPYFAFFWILTKKLALFYVVAMADL